MFKEWWDKEISDMPQALIKSDSCRTAEKTDVKRIDATIYFGLDGARTWTTIFVNKNATPEQIEEALKEEALNEIEIDWHEVK